MRGFKVLPKQIPVATVFIDTNILKFAAVKDHVLIPKKASIDWGGIQHEVEYHEPYIVNRLHKIKNEVQKRDAIFLGMLAYAGISERVRFYTHREVSIETWGLPRMASPSGRFFGCPLHDVSDPIATKNRIVLGNGIDAKEHTLEFVCGIKDERYHDLTRMTGAYQGEHKPLNLNQALDAYHIWCAESAKIAYFLTMDYKLKKVIEMAKIRTSVSIVTPNQLLRLIVPRFGLFGATKFMWQGYKFAKTLVGFNEGRGWT